jgi:NAD(P)-dependent dehydrogenase (short-subunit alcohol dehydrogenase family)
VIPSSNEDLSMNATYDFTGKVALVTGASDGIGFATAKGFAENGASVVLSDKDEERVLAATEKLASAGYPVLAVVCDVAVEAEAEELVVRAVAEFGRIDMAYNNADIRGPWGPATDESRRIFDAVNVANLAGIWASTKHQLIQMEKQGNGAIVNCASTGALIGHQNRGAYQSSKDGVLSLTRCAALDFATKNIRVNAICPDAIAMPKIADIHEDAAKEILCEQPMKRFGSSEEVAAAVLWLCSDSASFIQGVALPVDGGFTVYCT